MGDIRFFVQIKKGENYSDFWDKIEAKLQKVIPSCDWENVISYCREDCISVFDVSMEYDELLSAVTEIKKIIKTKGYVLGDYYDNGSDCVVAVICLGKEIRTVEGIETPIYNTDLEDPKAWLESTKEFMLNEDEIKYFKKTSGIKLNIVPVVVENIITLDRNVGVMEYGLNNKSITGIDTVDGLDLFINDMGFHYCPNLRRADFSKCSKLVINESAFEGCNQLVEVIFPANGNVTVHKTAFDTTGINITEYENIQITD